VDADAIGLYRSVSNAKHGALLATERTVKQERLRGAAPLHHLDSFSEGRLRLLRGVAAI